jgi:hypothetical protein
MPIRTENKDRYPENWAAIVLAIRQRAGDCCEGCGVRNHLVIKRISDGWRTPGAQEWEMIHSKVRHGQMSFSQSLKFHGFIRVICTTAHLDHQPENCAMENLRFWCQKCHNSYDAKHRAETRRHGSLKEQGRIEFITTSKE